MFIMDFFVLLWGDIMQFLDHEHQYGARFYDDYNYLIYLIIISGAMKY